jgi:hypothetical protein
MPILCSHPIMGWIENRPNKFLNQNFVRQGLPAKSKSVSFRFISLTYDVSWKTLDWGGKGGEGGGNEGVQKMVLARLHIFLCRQ